MSFESFGKKFDQWVAMVGTVLQQNATMMQRIQDLEKNNEEMKKDNQEMKKQIFALQPKTPSSALVSAIAALIEEEQETNPQCNSVDMRQAIASTEGIEVPVLKGKWSGVSSQNLGQAIAAGLLIKKDDHVALPDFPQVNGALKLAVSQYIRRPDKRQADSPDGKPKQKRRAMTPTKDDDAEQMTYGPLNQLSSPVRVKLEAHSELTIRSDVEAQREDAVRLQSAADAEALSAAKEDQDRAALAEGNMQILFNLDEGLTITLLPIANVMDVFMVFRFLKLKARMTKQYGSAAQSWYDTHHHQIKSLIEQHRSKNSLAEAAAEIEPLLCSINEKVALSGSLMPWMDKDAIDLLD